MDASTKGLDAAVIQKNGVDAYASRALTPAEQRYDQIEKEILAVVFGCEKIHKLLYGKRDVTIESDHAQTFRDNYAKTYIFCTNANSEDDTEITTL